jgi:hypothetical protein
VIFPNKTGIESIKKRNPRATVFFPMGNAKTKLNEREKMRIKEN